MRRASIPEKNCQMVRYLWLVQQQDTIGTTTKTDWMPALHSDWLYMRNYNTKGLTGLSAGTNGDAFVAPNACKAEFVTAPGIYATIIIYDR